VRALTEAKFDAKLPLYVASGVFLQLPDLVGKITSLLQPHAAVVLYKEMWTNASLWSPEELAAVDFLVVSDAEVFVGHASSSCSAFIAETRALRASKSVLAGIRPVQFNQAFAFATGDLHTHTLEVASYDVEPACAN
jgi:hypothetical protein